MVREGGLEPPRLSRWILSPVRLPGSATLADSNTKDFSYSAGFPENPWCHYWCHLLPAKARSSSLLTVLYLYKDAHGLVAGRCHYTKVIMSLQTPVINSSMSQVVESQVFDAGFLASHGKRFPNGADRPTQTGEYLDMGQALGQAPEHL
jgi:hypothetical protein